MQKRNLVQTCYESIVMLHPKLQQLHDIVIFVSKGNSEIHYVVRKITFHIYKDKMKQVMKREITSIF